MHRLPIAVVLAATALVLILAARIPAQNPPREAQPATNCVHDFFDSKNYDWYTIQNGCDMAVNVTLIPGNDDPRSVGLMEIPGNQKRSNGESRRDNSAHGGYMMYACPAKYQAYEADGKSQLRHNGPFKCIYSGF